MTASSQAPKPPTAAAPAGTKAPLPPRPAPPPLRIMNEAGTVSKSRDRPRG